MLANLIDENSMKTVNISSWETSIGRAKTCDIVLRNPTVSRFHAVIARRGKGWIIFDTGSKAGILVNGEKIDKYAKIYHGDILTIGSTVFRFSSPLHKRPPEKKTELKRERPDIEKEKPSMPPKKINADVLLQLPEKKPYPLLSGSCVIGRAASCDIVLPIRTVSQKHCRIERIRGVPHITDFNSAGGTYLNGKKITDTTPIHDGDILTIGKIKFRYCVNYTSK